MVYPQYPLAYDWLSSGTSIAIPSRINQTVGIISRCSISLTAQRVFCLHNTHSTVYCVATRSWPPSRPLSGAMVETVGVEPTMPLSP